MPERLRLAFLLPSEPVRGASVAAEVYFSNERVTMNGTRGGARQSSTQERSLY